MLVVKLIRYHQHGSLLLYVRVPRNPVVDYMTQASQVAKPYLVEGWHLTEAYID